MRTSDTSVQERITTFWNTVAPDYDSHPGNVPSPVGAECEAWIRAIEQVLPPQPSDVLDVGTGTGFLALIASQLGHRVIGLDLSGAMLAEARMKAHRRGLKVTFRVGDAVLPPFDEMSLDVIVCRHLLWTLREPEVALRNWLRLLRPSGRVVLIDGFWFANKPGQPEPEKGPGLFEEHYTERTREALPAMRWERVEPVADLLVTTGFCQVKVSDLAEIHKLADNPPSAEPWYLVTGRRPLINH
jgi:SAM-dependent methyltransferase